MIIINKKILKNNTYYPHFLATYMKTKEGQTFALSIMAQLIDGFEINPKGKIEAVHINNRSPIKFDLEYLRIEK